MTTPSKGAAVFLALFGLMFFVPAVLALYAFVVGSPNLPVSGKSFGGGIALLFCAIGAGLIYAAFAGYQRMKEQAAIAEAHPLEPWLLRKDWSVRTAKSQNRAKEVTLWVVCVLVNLILLPAAISFVPKLLSEKNPAAFVLLGFSSVGGILIAYAVRATLRHRRFGDTFFEFDSLPFSPGGRLGGRIHFKLDADIQGEVALRLSCVRKIVTGSGEDSTTKGAVLWQTEQTVSPGVLGMDATGRTIPVDFEIPADACFTSHDDPRDQVLWLLHAQANLPGLAYKDEFEVPVFKTSSSANEAAAGSSFGFSSQSAQPAFGPAQPVFSPLGARPTSRQAPASALVLVIVFAIAVASLFAWQGWRFATFRSAANLARWRRAQSRTATVSLPNRPAKPSAPLKAMTDEDAERILSLPAQDQAEELLEHAIGHDPRALELFERNVENWVGHIRLTDRMKQLEYRSQYSNDLRVRYANADINLTLDGWQKNDQAAEMLIERAHTDLHYRAAAVYFLGMLAGRDVAYDRIYPVLLDYAKHDPDPAVRQWAVEGMRYLGKDEALEQLWESFTQDPSMNVRDRAGCNISDCGNFTRLQRMRMVPKFLALLQDGSVTPQMRSWCFLALHEISDENVPNDVQAWQTWYGQHGAAKLAEFEKLDWWRVRGDE